MENIQVAKQAFVSLSHIVSWSYTLVETDTALSKGDIFDIILLLEVSTGRCYAIQDLEYILKFSRHTRDTLGLGVVEDHTLAYYVEKALQYQRTVEKKEGTND